MAREHFKTNRVCSSENYELSIRVHRTLYMDKYEKQQVEVAKCTMYINFFGQEIILKSTKAINKAKSNHIKIHLK